MNSNKILVEKEALKNSDMEEIGKFPSPEEKHLFFESRFESGNLRRATQVHIVLLLKGIEQECKYCLLLFKKVNFI